MKKVYTAKDVENMLEVYSKIISEREEMDSVFEELQKRLSCSAAVVTELIYSVNLFSYMTAEYLETNHKIFMRFIAIRLNNVTNKYNIQ